MSEGTATLKLMVIIYEELIDNMKMYISQY